MAEPGQQAEAFERCIAAGGIVVFPADTVYGLACDPDDREAIRRMYALKRRPLDKPSAVMFFDLEAALSALPELGARTRDALRRLMPGRVSVLLPNPGHRFPLVCWSDPSTLGLRVPLVPALAGARAPVLQSSANLAGEADPRTLQQVPEELREQADLVIDGGELPGTPSTVIDLREYEDEGGWSIVRPGAVSDGDVDAALRGQYHFDPAGYEAMIHDEVAGYEALHEQLELASGDGAERVLELGTGTGETALRLLARHPRAALVGVDVSDGMLAVARERLPGERVSLVAARLQDPLPDGPFDLVASALAIHHLSPAEKRELFARVHATVSAGGRFVLADVIVPVNPADATVPLTPGFDRPDTLSDLLVMLAESGFEATVTWSERDLAVLVGRVPA